MSKHKGYAHITIHVKEGQDMDFIIRKYRKIYFKSGLRDDINDIRFFRSKREKDRQKARKAAQRNPSK
jgi:ribosomal protein S21